MLNIRKRFFLLLTIVGVLLGFTACVSSKDTVRVSFDKPEYTVKVGQVLDITPIIEKGSNVEKVTIEYSSTNPDVATYVDGKLTGLQAGEAEIRIVCSEKPVAFDVATVKVVENEIPDVQFVEPQKSMIKGTTQTLQYKFVPEYASANMTFESANPDIATVDENGVISAVKAGKATIIARAIDVNDATQHKDYVFTIEVIEADFAINYVLNDGVNNPDNPAGYNILTLPLEILAPTKEAYRFLGWYDNAEFNGDPITEIAAGTTGDVTLYAKWELVIYSIVYELNGGTNAETNPDTYNIENLPLTLADPTKAGYTFLGWYNGENKVETIAKGSTGEVTVTAKWYNPNAELTLNCELNGGTLPEGAVIKFISKDGLATLPTPEKVGYTFKGWYADAECTQLVTSIEAGLSENPTVYAAWQINTYKITYETNGGEFQVDKTVPLYDSFEDLVAAFLSDYASFYNISGLTAASFFGKTNQYGPYGFFKNAEMNAKWGWLAEYILTVAKSTNYVGKANLVMGAGAANYNKYMRSNLAAFLQKAKLTNVTPVPMNFVNADCDALWAACPTKEIKVGIAAKYEYTVEELPLELATPVKGEAKFIGWYLNADLKNGKVEKLTIENLGDVKLYARWSDSEIEFDTYEIEYELNGGTLPEDAPKQYVEEAGAVLKDPTQAGYTFKGWFLDAECTQKVTEISKESKGNVKLYAAWEAIEYKVTFEVGEGKLPTEQVPVGKYEDYIDFVKDFIVDFNKHSKKTVAADGSDFFARSWMADGSSAGYNFLVSDEYKAKWGWVLTLINQVRVANGKAELTSTDGQAEARGEIHNLLNRTGNGNNGGNAEFGCDYTSADVNEQVWKYIEKVHYVDKVIDLVYTVEQLPITLPNPTAPEGKKFAGWYLNAEYTGEVVNIIAKGTTGDITLYAKLEADVYEITFVGATGLDKQTLAYGTTLPVPSETGWKFAGWYENPECTGEAVTTVTKSVTLYAKWVEDFTTFDHTTVEISVEADGTGDYKTLKEAYDNASDYTVIRLGAGTFDLDFVIAKSVEIIGKSKGETTIKVAADYITKVNAENIVISDVTLKGVGANVGGIYFQPGTKAHYFTIKNSEITDMNTVYKSVNAMSNNVVLTLENNTITKVGQFLIWATTGIDTVYLVDNTILASNCGTITNGYAALLRMRDGKTYVYNNVFTGTTPSIDGLFEAGTDNIDFIEVKYNIFKNIQSE